VMVMVSWIQFSFIDLLQWLVLTAFIILNDHETILLLNSDLAEIFSAVRQL